MSPSHPSDYIPWLTTQHTQTHVFALVSVTPVRYMVQRRAYLLLKVGRVEPSAQAHHLLGRVAPASRKELPQHVVNRRYTRVVPCGCVSCVLCARVMRLTKRNRSAVEKGVVPRLMRGGRRVVLAPRTKWCRKLSRQYPNRTADLSPPEQQIGIKRWNAAAVDRRPGQGEEGMVHFADGSVIVGEHDRDVFRHGPGCRRPRISATALVARRWLPPLCGSLGRRKRERQRWLLHALLLLNSICRQSDLVLIFLFSFLFSFAFLF